MALHLEHMEVRSGSPEMDSPGSNGRVNSSHTVKLINMQWTMDCVADDDMNRIDAEDVHALLCDATENIYQEDVLSFDHGSFDDTDKTYNLVPKTVVENGMCKTSGMPWNQEVNTVTIRLLPWWCKKCKLFLQNASVSLLGRKQPALYG